MSATYSSAAEAEHGADRARDDLAKTIEQLKSNLTPGRLAGEAVDAAKARTPRWALDAWDTALSPAALSLLGVAVVGVVVTMWRQKRR